VSLRFTTAVVCERLPCGRRSRLARRAGAADARAPQTLSQDNTIRCAGRNDCARRASILRSKIDARLRAASINLAG
jgi:hypothetical protein